MRRVLLIGICTVLLAAVSGCSGQPDDISADTEAVKSTILEYNEALIRAFAKMDMNELGAVATEDQAYTEFYLMAALGEGRVRMVSKLVDVEFGEITFPEEGRATAITTETWDYVHESLDTSETVRSEQGLVYHLRYELVLQDGGWLVDRVTSLDDPPASEETTP